MLPRHNRFFHRVFEYASKTGIELKTVPRLSAWKRFGLPDMRGFIPHLRRVNVFEDRAQQAKALVAKPALDEGLLWLVHDLLHVIFYDFASLNLGADCWNDDSRFLENHLASEVFAVLALDYHCLIETDTRGLAVDVSAADWKAFQDRYPQLPDHNSFEFCEALTGFYLSGEGLLQELTAALPARSRRGADEKMRHWLGHEWRYSQKQRFYVADWLHDLKGEPAAKSAAVIEDSFVAEPLWELLGYFHRAAELDWKIYLKEAKGLRSVENYFSNFKKYKAKNFHADFRYTDHGCFSKAEVTKNLAGNEEPTASGLFLLWQILSSGSPQLMSTTERKAVQTLSLSAQTKKVDKNAWGVINKLTQRQTEARAWEADPLTRATFFLP